jgi:signal peptide peptidase SppA
MRVLDAALTTTWAMEPNALERFLEIASRQNEVTPEALEAYRAKSLDRAERAKMRDGVAIIEAIGPMFQRANLMTEMSGATSYANLRRDFQTAMDDPKVKAVLLNVDSPGGSALGVNELAEAVYQARGKKPIIAYVGGMGASAGYWLASAADRVIVDPLAVLGSIGAQIATLDTTAADEKRGVKRFRFVSSVSPNKNADPGTEAGDAEIQKTVDAMGEVFVEAVARNRGVDTKTVLNDFGKGGTFVGKDAVKAGLADAVGDFESVLAELSAGRKKTQAAGSTARKGTSMSDTPAEPAIEPKAETVDAAALVASALAAERTRMAGIDRIAAAHAVPADVVAKAKEDGTDVATFALAVADLAAKAKADAGEKQITALKADEEKAGKVSASKDNEPTEAEAREALVKNIVAAADLADGK